MWHQKENLLDLDLVPAALIYLSTKNQEKSFLKEEILNKVSNATGAEQVLSEGRVLKKDFKYESIESEPVQVSGGSVSGSASGSGSVMKADQSAIKRPTTSNSDKSGNTKMPRWFKPSKWMKYSIWDENKNNVVSNKKIQDEQIQIDKVDRR